MAKQRIPPFTLPGSTIVELVGTKSGKPVAKKQLTLDEANIEKKKFEQNRKWRGWYFQIYQLGFSSHSSNNDQISNPQK